MWTGAVRFNPATIGRLCHTIKHPLLHRLERRLFGGLCRCVLLHVLNLAPLTLTFNLYSLAWFLQESGADTVALEISNTHPLCTVIHANPIRTDQFTNRDRTKVHL